MSHIQNVWVPLGLARTPIAKRTCHKTVICFKKYIFPLFSCRASDRGSSKKDFLGGGVGGKRECSSHLKFCQHIQYLIGSALLIQQLKLKAFADLFFLSPTTAGFCPFTMPSKFMFSLLMGLLIYLAVQPFYGCQSSLKTENGCANLHNCLGRVHAKCANVHNCLGPTLERWCNTELSFDIRSLALHRLCVIIYKAWICLPL